MQIICIVTTPKDPLLVFASQDILETVKLAQVTKYKCLDNTNQTNISQSLICSHKRVSRTTHSNIDLESV